MFHGPIRGGTRGGQGLFKWDDVKEDKDRENYLGHSLKAPVGRWQQDKDLTWYAKEGGTISKEQKEKEEQEELERIKEQEADALAMALGYTGPRLTKYKKESINEEDIKHAVKGAAVDVHPEGRGFSTRGSYSGKSSSTFQRIDVEKGNAIITSSSSRNKRNKEADSDVEEHHKDSDRKRSKKEKKKKKSKKSKKKKHKESKDSDSNDGGHSDRTKEKYREEESRRSRRRRSPS